MIGRYRSISHQRRSPMRLIPIMTAMAMLAQVSAAAAQPAFMPRPMPNAARGEVRVQVNVSFFVAGTVNHSAESLQEQENARRSLYERAGKECEVLKATIAAECRLISVNVNTNRQFGQQEGFNANGSFAFAITPK